VESHAQEHFVSRQLSQQEIDAVFQNLHAKKNDPNARKAAPFDFRRPDRIAKSQLRAIHVLHDNFVRNMVSSLSAYLRTYLIVNLVSVEQLSYAEFLECLPSPTCIVALGLRPYDGNAVLEINSSLIFPILEILLGGNGKSLMNLQREITEIEQSLLDGLFRIILRDLRESWKGIAQIDFSIDSLETEPQFLQILAPSEAVVAIAIEIRIGDSVGMMNIAMPSIIIKMMRQKFDQQWSVRKTESTDREQTRMLDLIRDSGMTMEARLDGPTIRMQDLIRLEQGDILSFDFPVHRPLECLLNGKQKFHGRMVASGSKLAFQVKDVIEKPASNVLPDRAAAVTAGGHSG
jgi:flagellar motor switch protein FliM